MENENSVIQYRILPLFILACIVLLGAVIYSHYTQPIYSWDEALYANNAIEMFHNKHWLVYTRDGLADHYNSKPPLFIWLQVVCVFFFSYYEWVFRLPTLLSLLGIIYLYWRFNSLFNYPKFVAVCAGLILLSTPGIIRPHVFLSGDLDGTLVFFTTALSVWKNWCSS